MELLVRSSAAVLLALCLVACRPDVESTIPCTTFADLACPTGWHCGESGTCVNGEGAPRVVFQLPLADAQISGETEIAFTASSALGLTEAKLQFTRDGARLDIPVVAAISEDSFTGHFTARLNTLERTDGPGTLVATVRAKAGVDGSATQAITIRNAL